MAPQQNASLCDCVKSETDDNSLGIYTRTIASNASIKACKNNTKLELSMFVRSGSLKSKRSKNMITYTTRYGQISRTNAIFVILLCSNIHLQISRLMLMSSSVKFLNTMFIFGLKKQPQKGTQHKSLALRFNKIRVDGNELRKRRNAWAYPNVTCLVDVHFVEWIQQLRLMRGKMNSFGEFCSTFPHLKVFSAHLVLLSGWMHQRITLLSLAKPFSVDIANAEHHLFSLCYAHSVWMLPKNWKFMREV